MAKNTIYVQHDGFRIRKGDGARNTLRKSFATIRGLKGYLNRLLAENPFCHIDVWLYDSEDISLRTTLGYVEIKDGGMQLVGLNKKLEEIYNA